MEDYKKKYEQLLKFINDLYPHMSDYCKEKTEGFIPELKESEDERIRKALVQYLKDYPNLPNGNYCRDDFFAWLEKQGEQPNKVSIWKHWNNGIAGNGEGKIVYLVKSGNTYKLSSCLGFECDYIELSELDKLYVEKQGEQKATDKIEPKFKVGDYIINEHGFIMQIDGIDGNMYVYHVLDDNRLLKHDITKTDESCHRWTIQDAKEGDVLAWDDSNCIVIFSKIENDESFMSHGFIGNITEMFEKGYNGHSITNHLHPATKEQRDLLFSKMKEAGYKWDAEKKELKKIGQEDDAELTDFESALFSAFSDAWQEYLSGKEVNVKQWVKENSKELLDAVKEELNEQSLTWSEEDEKHYQGCLNAMKLMLNAKPYPYYNDYLWLKSLKDRVKPQSKQEWSEEEKARIDKIIDVLDWAEEKGYIRYSDWEDYVCYVKSLRPHITWKPSDEQMDALNLAIGESNSVDTAAGDEAAEILTSLYEQLKKLREE